MTINYYTCKITIKRSKLCIPELIDDSDIDHLKLQREKDESSSKKAMDRSHWRPPDRSVRHDSTRRFTSKAKFLKSINWFFEKRKGNFQHCWNKNFERKHCYCWFCDYFQVDFEIGFWIEAKLIHFKDLEINTQLWSM